MDRPDLPAGAQAWSWPPFDPEYLDDAAERTKRREMLVLANRGEVLEPQNTFFDWMKLATLIALDRDDEALQVLHMAAKKTGYDSHLRDQIHATLAAFERLRPLTPKEELELARNVQIGDDAQIATIAACVSGLAIQLRQRGDDQAAVTAGDDLLRLGETVHQAPLASGGGFDGMDVEYTAIQQVYAPPVVRGSPQFPILPPNLSLPGGPDNLARYAMTNQRPEVARDVLHAWRDINNGTVFWFESGAYRHMVIRVGWNRQIRPWTELASGAQDRWGRMLLSSSFGCLLVWMVSTSVTLRRREDDQSFLLRPGQGAALGASVILTLMALEAATSAHFPGGWKGRNYLATAPELAEDVPLIVAASVCCVLVLPAFAMAARWQTRAVPKLSWTARTKRWLPNFEEVRAGQLASVFRCSARCTFGLIQITILISCLQAVFARGTAEDYRKGVLSAVALAWLYGFAVAMARWSSLPDRTSALALVFANLRRLTAGYLVAALLIYALGGLAVLRVDAIFNAEVLPRLGMDLDGQ